jgi:hypothetical protein
MNETLSKLVAGLVAIGMATAVLLPGRQTPQVVNAFGKVLTGGLRTSITGK